MIRIIYNTTVPTLLVKPIRLKDVKESCHYLFCKIAETFWKIFIVARAFLRFPNYQKPTKAQYVLYYFKTHLKTFKKLLHVSIYDHPQGAHVVPC
jgi:hypothetical protein